MSNNRIGEKYGRYLIIDKCDFDPKRVLCRCDCGTEKYVLKSNLFSGKSKSCGCLIREVTTKRNLKHGQAKTRLYQVWSNMRRRCYDPKNNRYQNYGGKGVKVCREWLDFESFQQWANQSGYDANAEYGKCTLDRINVNGDYEPSNCRWVDIQKQCNNRTSNVILTFNGKSQNITQWERELGFPKDRLENRLRKGWSTERALTTPLITR